MGAGLRSVRVLVVSPEGLVSIYHPEKAITASVINISEVTTTTPIPTTPSSTTTTTTIPTTAMSLGTSTTTTRTPSPLEEMQKTWSKMMKVDENYPPMHKMVDETRGPAEEEEEQEVAAHTEEGDEEEVTVHEEIDLWDLKRLSLIHQKSLVIAELSWNPVKFSEEQEYLITWELDGGGLKGHLVTDSTTVSLSLWPDTLYHIQVIYLQH